MTLDPIEAFPRKEELVRENSSIELRMASVDITKTTLFTSRNLFSIPNDGSNTKPMFPIFFFVSCSKVIFIASFILYLSKMRHKNH